MKFKHHLNEQKKTWLTSFFCLVSATLGLFLSLSLSADSASLGPAPPPPRTPLSFTLFTDYLTIQVLNKNEVRKWFEDYRSCRNMPNSNKFFVCVCVKEQVTKKRINECI